MTQLYKIEELYTAGWALIDPKASKLTKNVAMNFYNTMLEKDTIQIISAQSLIMKM